MFRKINTRKDSISFEKEVIEQVERDMDSSMIFKKNTKSRILWPYLSKLYYNLELFKKAKKNIESSQKGNNLKHYEPVFEAKVQEVNYIINNLETLISEFESLRDKALKEESAQYTEEEKKME